MRSFSPLILVVIVGVGLWLWSVAQTPAPTPPVQETENPTTAPTPPPATEAGSLTYPVADFANRITKKPFGIYITPQTSPVQPEKFSGYHTGVDVEYADTAGAVPVVAIADGVMTTARYATGYGGVVTIEHQILSQTVIAVYGHLNIDSVTKAVGATFAQGETIGILGDGYTSQTDNERKHLHFGLVKKGAVSNVLLGYVANQSHLSAWLNPWEVF